MSFAINVSQRAAEGSEPPLELAELLQQLGRHRNCCLPTPFIVLRTPPNGPGRGVDIFPAEPQDGPTTPSGRLGEHGWAGVYSAMGSSRTGKAGRRALLVMIEISIGASLLLWMIIWVVRIFDRQ